jgi:hypothetical protein
MKFCVSCGHKLEVAGSDNPVAKIDEQPDISSPNPSSLDGSESTSEPLYLNAKEGIVIAGIAVLALIGLAIGTTISDTRENDRLADLGQKVADSCAEKLLPANPDVVGAKLIRHREEAKEVVIEVLDLGGNQAGSNATCEYATADGMFSIEAASWSTQLDGVDAVIRYDGATNLVTVNRETPTPDAELPESVTAESCEQAFRAAASVPLGMENNAEISATTWACSDVEEWWNMLNQYPDTFGVTYLLESEKGMFVGSACVVGANSPVCVDAARIGLTF